MLNMHQIGWSGAVVGCVVSAILGFRFPQGLRLVHLIQLAGLTIVLGLGLSVAAGAFHAGCERFLSLCVGTTDTTVWGVLYPIISVPAMWLTGCLTYFLSRAAHR